MFELFEVAIISGFVAAFIIDIIAAKKLFALTLKTIPELKKNLKKAPREQKAKIEYKIMSYRTDIYCYRILLIVMTFILAIGVYSTGNILITVLLIALAVAAVVID